MQIPLLLYHQINHIPVEKDPYRISVSPEQFERQMAYLRQHEYTALTLSQAFQKATKGEPLPQRPVVISFDDGYRDNYTTAFPMLKQYDLTATIFLVTGQIGDYNNWDQSSPDEAFALMTWEQVREMEAAGIEFGSHTHTHAALDMLDHDAATRELYTSRQTLEEQLGHPVMTLAYPYERFTRETLDIAKHCGYIAACGSSLLPESPFNLWRAEIGTDVTEASFRFKLSPWWRRTQQAKRQLRPIKRLLLGSRS
ncbi:MAG: polysaccharide deacetylase family protein [Chloroflexi bacterium]|nr:polysaccharide deacetylase family protein [Chloroflexota bacterium]